MQTAMKRLSDGRAVLGARWRAGALAAAPAMAATAYVTNEKGNTISVIDLDKIAVS